MGITCRERGAGERHMDNRIGRRAAIAGADRMAADDVMGSVLQLLPNEDSQLLRHMPLADGAAKRLIAGPG